MPDETPDEINVAPAKPRSSDPQLPSGPDFSPGPHFSSGKRPPFECIALLLQGGGALGAYQGGAYESLAAAGIQPDWVAGISIGAINAAIIAGNPPEMRVTNLRRFWKEITTEFPWNRSGGAASDLFQFDALRRVLNGMSAMSAMLNGVANFYTPRLPPAWLDHSGSLDATSYYDTAKLKAKLVELIDFDLINDGPMHLSVGAVDVTNGNFVYFDTETHTIGPEHIMASGALPPGFPAVEIDGAHYWDGGLVSNTPLSWVLERLPRQDTLAFQIDLWSAEGVFPSDLGEVATRQKEIQFSSRTRANTDRFKYAHALRRAFAKHFDSLPEAIRQTPEAQLLNAAADRKLYNIVHLIYHTKVYEGISKDFEFSRRSMEEHWQAGLRDTAHTIAHPEVFQRPTNDDGIAIFDFTRGETENHRPNVDQAIPLAPRR